MRGSLEALLLSAAVASAVITTIFIIARSKKRRTPPHRIVVVNTIDCRVYRTDLIQLVRSSFPESAEAVEDGTDVLESLCGFHEPNDCEWLLSFVNEHVVGMAMIVEYHDSLYVASLCVLPAFRGCGLGSRLMRSASALAYSRGLKALSGSVFGGSARLIAFYEELGGSIEANFSSGGTRSSVVPAQRLRAPSGRTTARDVPPPPRLEAK